MNKYLAQAIEARSVDREKSTHVSLLTLSFKDKEKENQVKQVVVHLNVCSRVVLRLGPDIVSLDCFFVAVSQRQRFELQ